MCKYDFINIRNIFEQYKYIYMIIISIKPKKIQYIKKVYICTYVTQNP